MDHMTQNAMQYMIKKDVFQKSTRDDPICVTQTNNSVYYLCLHMARMLTGTTGQRLGHPGQGNFILLNTFLKPGNVLLAAGITNSNKKSTQ